MAQDIAPELLEAVEQSFRKILQNNEKIRKLREILEKGEATYQDADRFALEEGQALAKAFHDNVSGDVLPDGKMFYNIASRVIPPPLRSTYEEVAEFALTMQRGMNERARIGILPQRAAYNTDREKALIERTCRPAKYDDVRDSVEAYMVNFSQAVVTDTLHTNAQFQYEAGLSPVIHRRASGGCCEWCRGLAGDYPYADYQDRGNDIYRRHRDCRCEVTYDPGEGRVQNVHTKLWE